MKKYWFVFKGNALVIERLPDGRHTVPLCEEPPLATVGRSRVRAAGVLRGSEVMASLMADGEEGVRGVYELCPLRASYYKLPADMYDMAGKCEELLYWDANTAYCGRCGGEMLPDTAISKRCRRCGNVVWPQLSTAVITLVHRGDEILLAHANNFKGDFYGLIAGFVETGETLEQAVEREVMEETGLSIRDLRYFGSQPWPYPCGLMVGFFAEYAGGEIKLQRSELASAGWYKAGSLPQMPEKLSIARRMIDKYLADRSGG